MMMLLSTFVLCTMLFPTVSECAAAPKPNIVFFMADDLGWHNVQWHNTDMKTPNAAKLVAQGIELDRHYAYVYCSPSRSSLMSGRLPFHVQQKNFNNCDLSQGVPRNMTFIASKLKSAGYRTAQFGKWHLGCSSAGHIPAGRGFDVSLTYFEGAEDHFTQRSCIDAECIKPVNITAPDPKGWFQYSPFDLWQHEGPATGLAGKQYNGYLFANMSVQFIKVSNGSCIFQTIRRWRWLMESIPFSGCAAL
eukprot:m.310808 g.310808  ORF g.310808 m.310808 type:complete len:248 (-) comp20215_c0_seq2:1683-2426(-)